jgi:hypothetical protein
MDLKWLERPLRAPNAHAAPQDAGHTQFPKDKAPGDVAIPGGFERRFGGGQSLPLRCWIIMNVS